MIGVVLRCPANVANPRQLSLPGLDARVPQVMNVHIPELGAGSCPAPRKLKIGEAAARMTADNHPRFALDSG